MEVPLIGKLNRPLPWILALMAGGILAVGAITYKLVETPSPEVELEKLTVPVKRETLAVEIDANGTIEPIQSVNISPKNPGRLAKLLVEQGMKVKQGQTLAVMDNLEVQAQGFQAQAKFQEAIANYEATRLRIPEEIKQAQARMIQAQARWQEAQGRLIQAEQRIPKDINQIQAQLQAANAKYKLAQARVKRNQELVKEGAIASDRFDEIFSDYLNAQASLLEIQQRLEQAQSTANPEIGQIQQEIRQYRAAAAEAKIEFEQRQKTAQAELAQLEAAAKAAQAELERIKIQYRETVIVAPFDGIITQKYATEGAFVTPTTSASTTASATSTSIVALARGLEVVAKVPEVDIGTLQVGQPVSIVADAYPTDVFQGMVIRIAPEAIVEQNVTSFEVRVALDKPGQQKLRSKMNVDATFLGQQLSNALVVPTVAIVTQKGETGVMVPNAENQPQFKSVSIGMVLDDKTQILTGLSAGERVFIDLPEEADPDKKPDAQKG